MNPVNDPKNLEEVKLDPQVTKAIKAIIEKDLSAITEDEKSFLRARKSYLGKTSRDKFSAILNEKVEVKQEEVKPPENTEEEADTTDDNVE